MGLPSGGAGSGGVSTGGSPGSGGAASSAGGQGGAPVPDDAAAPAPADGPLAPPAPEDEQPLPACKRTVPVANSVTLATAISAAQPGDCIAMADGGYTFPVIGAKGTAAAPIVISAVNPLKATVSTGDLKLENAAHVVVQGISWTGNGTIWLTDTDHGRISRFRIQRMETAADLQSHDLAWITVFGPGSQYCRIDHNDFGPQKQKGNMILVTGDEDKVMMAQHTRIDHNHFHDVNYGGGNGWETIRSGADTLSFASAFTIIEHNLFTKDANDPEVISIKSSDNIVRYNTLRASAGQFVFRHGNRSLMYGNYVLGDGVAGSKGLRINGGQHKIFNNYIEGVGGPGIFLEGGNSTDSTGVLQDHKQIYKTDVVFNTVINAGEIAVGGVHPLDPVDCNIAYNLVQGSGALYTQGAGSKNITFMGNIASPGAPAVKTGIMVVDPKLTKMGEVFTIGAGSPAANAGKPAFPYVTADSEGKSRSDGMPDVGAFEVSAEPARFGLLSAADVGPLAP
jgi:poly(beta-D-mannuronate) lyase